MNEKQKREKKRNEKLLHYAYSSIINISSSFLVLLLRDTSH